MDSGPSFVLSGGTCTLSVYTDLPVDGMVDAPEHMGEGEVARTHGTYFTTVN